MGVNLIKGKNVKISDVARLYGNIEIGDNVRIDDFCILTGNIKIGSNIHIGCYSFLSGSEGIVFEDYAGCAPRTTILTASDDYKGHSLTWFELMVSPVIPDKFKPRLHRGKITIKRHVLLGFNCCVMPGVTLNEGCSFGAYSLINKDCDAWGIYAGIPIKRIGDRSKDMLELEKEFEQWQQLVT